jgi:hypothetical protein
MKAQICLTCHTPFSPEANSGKLSADRNEVCPCGSVPVARRIVHEDRVDIKEGTPSGIEQRVDHGAEDGERPKSAIAIPGSARSHEAHKWKHSAEIVLHPISGPRISESDTIPKAADQKQLEPLEAAATASL